MTPSQLIAHVQQSIGAANQLQSKLTAQILEIEGLTSVKMRHLMNNLGAMPGLDYFHAGVENGALFIATAYENRLNSIMGVDQWSLVLETARQLAVIERCELFLPGQQCKVFEVNCFQMGPKYFKEPINLYFYDGEHDEESQVKALTQFRDYLADTCILLVDDFNWDSVAKGTLRGLREGRYRVLYQATFKDPGREQWWNGLYVAVIEKE